MEKQSEITQPIPSSIYDAVLNEDINSFNNLLAKNKSILDRCIFEKSCIFMQSPLHIAVEMRRLDFVEAILDQNPKLAEVVDQIKRSTPLHIAAATKESVGIVKALLKTRPGTSFVHDQDGMTPLHIAAVNGNTKVLQLLLRKKHQAALDRTPRGETILHLCVKNSHLHTLKKVVKDTYDLELLNSEDSDGNTVLHLAVAYKENEMVKFLLKQGDKIDKNAMNKKDKTARDIFDLTKIRQDSKDTKSYVTDKLFKLICWDSIIGWKRENEEDKLTDDEDDEDDEEVKKEKEEEDELRKEADKDIENSLRKHYTLRAEKVLKHRDNEKWLEEQNTALMVVASCIATLSFQVGISPPGSVWQDNNGGHEAGTSIMSYDNDGEQYNIVQVSNTIGLMASLSVILLLISGLPCRRHFVFILRVTLWIAVTASATTYFFTIGYLTNELWDKAVLVEAIEYSVEVWLWLMLVILFGHGMHFIWMLIGHNKRSKVKQFLRTEQLCQYA